MNYDENNEEPITTPDTSNSTRINHQEGTDPTLDKLGNGKWERLSNINTGVVDSFGNADTQKQRTQYRSSVFDTVADRLSLPDFIHREGRQLIMEEIDLQQLSAPSVDTEFISFCLATILLEERSNQRSYHPYSKNEDNDDLILEFQKENNYGDVLIDTYRQKLSNGVDSL